jgi:hypothetical protein
MSQTRERPSPEAVFRYPDMPHARRHSPGGYVDDEHYKPWLRDEFTFRCVYCRCREVWFPYGDRNFSVEHARPTSLAPAGRNGPGRRGDYSPQLPQIRRCPIKANGSSRRGLMCALLLAGVTVTAPGALSRRPVAHRQFRRRRTADPEKERRACGFRVGLDALQLD